MHASISGALFTFPDRPHSTHTITSHLQALRLHQSCRFAQQPVSSLTGASGESRACNCIAQPCDAAIALLPTALCCVVTRERL
jgi:hypothetical protein